MATSQQYDEAARAVASGTATDQQRQWNNQMAEAGTRESSHRVRAAQDANTVRR